LFVLSAACLPVLFWISHIVAASVIGVRWTRHLRQTSLAAICENLFGQADDKRTQLLQALTRKKFSEKIRLNFMRQFPMKTRSPVIYEFRPYRLESAESRLYKHGKLAPSRPKFFELLTLLVEHHGHMLERDEMLGAGSF
jgi:DNA-binding response OmpR family regulator